MGLSATRVTAVVPTVGKSPALVESLGALRRDGAGELRIVLVAQGDGVPAIPAELEVERIEVPEPIGFARAVNLGIAAARTVRPYASTNSGTTFSARRPAAYARSYRWATACRPRSP